MVNARYIKQLGLVVVLGIAMGLSGCSTPEYRIKQNPEVFASFPVDAQVKIRQGVIDIGFTEDMVSMALGKPSRIYTRKTSEGLLEVWSYTDSFRTTDQQRLRADVRTRDARGRYTTSREWVMVDVPLETEYEKVRVEFVHGKVSAIDMLQR